MEPCLVGLLVGFLQERFSRLDGPALGSAVGFESEVEEVLVGAVDEIPSVVGFVHPAEIVLLQVLLDGLWEGWRGEVKGREGKGEAVQRRKEREKGCQNKEIKTTRMYESGSSSSTSSPGGG